jgi:hypothetical protein
MSCSLSRQMRRAQKRQIQKCRARIPLPVRVHEAGHAMARLLTCSLMNIPCEHSVSHVDLGEVKHIGDDGSVWLDNVTWGPMFTDQMNTIYNERHGVVQGMPPADAVVKSQSPVSQEDFDAFKAAGCDTKGWLLAQCVIALGGIVAEAKYLDEPLDEVLDKFEVRGDLINMHPNAYFLRRKFVSGSMADRAIAFLEHVLGRPDVWAATLAIAKGLNAPGRTEGEVIFRTAVAHLKSIPVLDLSEATQVVVRRDYNASKSATYFLDDLEGWHWSDVSGGRQNKAPQKFLYAYAWCSDLIDGDLNHSCQHGEGPHHVKVCITRTDNQEAWAEIQKEAAWSMHREREAA